MRSGAPRRRALRALSASLVVDTAAMMPVALAGALVVQIRTDLGLTDALVGSAVGLFFFSGGLVAGLLGPQVDHLGWRRSALIGSGLTTVALAGLAALQGWWQLVLFLLLGGVGLAASMPATNLLLAREMPERRLALTISLKQAAVPVALLLAGLAVPAIGLTVGWRWAFLGAAALPVVGLLMIRATDAPATPPEPGSRARGRAAQRAMLGLSVSMFLAALVPGALTGFLVVSVVRAGLGEGAAGLLFAASNLAGIVVRLAAGVYADRTGTDGYRPVAALMIAGGLGTLLLATGEVAAMIPGSVLAFGMGWGWPGLMFFLVVRAHMDSAGSVSGLFQSAGMIGSATGPVVFGAVAQLVGMNAAWLAVACASIAAGLLVARARPARPPALVETGG